MPELLHIDAADPTPIYLQLERAIRFAIATEKLVVGDRLPTVRQLAVDLKVNANTVARVYAELERTGTLETRRGVGTFVRQREVHRGSRQDRDRELISLADRFLWEASSLGFSLGEVLEHLQARSKKENQEYAAQS
jgi:GntR family transcriptional regulator